MIVLAFLMFCFFIGFLVAGLFALIKRSSYAKKYFLFSFFSAVIFIISIFNIGSDEVQKQEVRDEPKQEESAVKPKPKEEKKAPVVKKEEPKKEEKKQEPKKQEPKKDKKAAPVFTTKEVSHGPSVLVTKVVDGDTIHVSMNGKDETVRLLLIDTPETVHPQKPVEPFGREASNFAKQTMQGKNVQLQMGTEERDKYGRLLAYVWVGDTTYQEMVLERGLAATAYLYNDLSMLDEFHKAQDVARDKKIGVWSIPGYAQVDQEHGFNSKEEKKAVAVAPKPKTAQPSKPKLDVYYPNCEAVRAAGAAPVHKGEPGYAPRLDRDGDGIGCDK